MSNVEPGFEKLVTVLCDHIIQKLNYTFPYNDNGIDDRADFLLVFPSEEATPDFYKWCEKGYATIGMLGVSLPRHIRGIKPLGNNPLFDAVLARTNELRVAAGLPRQEIALIDKVPESKMER